MPSTDSEHVPPVVPAPTAFVVPMPGDIELAKSIAQAVRGVPDVVDMSPGRYVLAATYGPGEHVVGVVILHPTETELSIEVHVVAAYLASMNSLYASPRHKGKDDSGGEAVLFRLADSIRKTVFQTVEQFGLPAPLAVDVSIDGIR